MKLALKILAALLVLGCAQSEPAAPLQPKNPPTDSGDVWILLMVVDPSGVCIPGATIQIVAGQGVGEPITQKTPCEVWGDWGGVDYHHLTVGEPMTLRATAPDYATEEKTITPRSGPVSAIFFTPLPLR